MLGSLRSYPIVGRIFPIHCDCVEKLVKATDSVVSGVVSVRWIVTRMSLTIVWSEDSHRGIVIR